MEKLSLTIKDKKGNIIKTVEACSFEVSFGTIDKLMSLIDIDEKTTSFELLKKVSTTWKEITGILDEIFPGMTKEDWCMVKVNDLVPLILQVVKYTFSEIMGIPSEKKN